jgi:beta-1,4-mannosyl-glycoprotein beta-1,4-N-acetylglucosaminyltransferase
MVFDCFPFFDELDVLEIRLHEMAPLVDKFVIIEAGETYGGDPKPFNLEPHLSDRFKDFPILYVKLDKLEPKCIERVTGRLREAYQRNLLMPTLAKLARPDDVIIFSDCDEIPRMTAVRDALPRLQDGILRLKQRSFYYNVNTLVDYGNDFASRARVGLWRDVKECRSMYAFRMYLKDLCPAIENGGWHFSYFGDIAKIKRKVAALSPFLSEYKLFGDDQLAKDINERKDLHHRRCELPKTFAVAESDDPTLPEYFLANRDKFKHFTLESQ